jgi:disulfide oxidoreductase YuzD
VPSRAGIFIDARGGDRGLLQSQRSVLIDEYIVAHPEADLKFRFPVELSGQRNDLSVYRLPIELLAYSIRNGRFAAELLEEEARLGRKLEETPSDMTIIKRLLLEQSKNATEELKRSIRQVGQLHPGVVTTDGYVINGNRRMAVLESLYEEEHLPKYQFLEVARLPPNVNPKDLWRIEAGIQLSKEDTLEYGAINERLKLREGIELGLDDAEMSRTMSGRYTPNQVDQKLRELQLIEDYLEYIGKPKQYTLAERRSESFIDMRAGIEALEEQEASDESIFAYVQMTYEMIKGDSTHWDIRDLNKIFRIGGEPSKSIIDYFNPAGGAKPTGGALEVFESAREVYDAQQNVKRPLKLVKKAINALQPVKADDPILKTPEAKEAINKLWKKVYALMQGSNSP